MLPDKQMLECELLVIRWKRGDRAAFGKIIAMWERSLFYYLRRLASSEADAWELLQETWLKVFRSLGSLRDTRALPSFLYTTARNTAISRLRTPAVAMSAACEELANAESAVDDVAAFDNAEAVHHALDQLPLLHREALTLFFLRELSLDEMAKLLDVPIGTVKSRLHYGKSALLKILKGQAHGN